MKMLEIALDCINRGWYVFPCFPKTKKPMTEHGYKDATQDARKVREWWSALGEPNANVAIATGKSGLCVVDIDHGLVGAPREEWTGTPGTYTVRTGRRPEFGAQLYFAGEGLKSTGWRLNHISGDIRCSTGYVMAAGSIHPSGEAYTVLYDAPVAPVPEWVRTLTAPEQNKDAVLAVDADKVEAWKTWLLDYAGHCHLEPTGFEKYEPNGWRMGIVCPWDKEHTPGAGTDSSTVLCILDGKVVFICSHGGSCQAKKRDTVAFKAEMVRQYGDFAPEPGADPVAFISGKAPEPEPEPVDWREHYHTYEETENAPPVTFIVDHFLARECITGLAAPAGQRKSLIALNVVHAVCTGLPLFDHFPVLNAPKKVLYLCPEMGLSSFADRVKKIGLLPYVGKTFFFRSMNKELLPLEKLAPEEMDGALLIVDTAIRYIKGSENDSADMREFAKLLMSLIGPGKLDAILMLYHSGKGTKESPELTLENALRGSSELGAALACCWSTRLQDPKEYYRSPSFLSCVKQRDFLAEGDFEIGSLNDEDPRLHIQGTPGLSTLKSKFSGNRDNKDEDAEQIIRQNPEAKIPELIEKLKDAGCKRGKNWVSEHRRLVFAKGSTHTEG